MDKTRRKVTETLSRLKAKHGIDKHQLTYCDFEQICENENIVIVSIAKPPGLYFRVGTVPAIAIGTNLTPEELPHVAFHELGHYLMHDPHNVGEVSPQSEREADMFAEAATNLKRIKRL